MNISVNESWLVGLEIRRGSSGPLPAKVQTHGGSEVKWLRKTAEMDAVKVKMMSSSISVIVLVWSRH